MEEKNKIRLLKAEEIDVRVGAIYKDYISLLLYADARTVAEILDEAFGPMGWQRKHHYIDGVMFCELSVKDKSGEWISRMDLGTASYSDPEKGMASDSFKRSAVMFSVTKELYSSPPIYINIDKVTIKEVNGKKTVKDRFSVQTIQYDEEKRCITGLVIINQNKEVVYQYMAAAGNKRKSESVIISPEQIKELYEQLNRTGVPLSQVLTRYKIKTISEMSPEVWLKAMNSLRMTASKVA